MSAATSELMTDYYAAREAQEVRLEATTGTRDHGHEEAGHFFERAGTDGRGERPVTFREWMRQTAAPKPGPEDAAELERREWVALQDAHAAVAAAEEAYNAAVRARDAAFLARTHGGSSLGDIARMVGVSRTTVHNIVTRGRETAGTAW